MIHRILATAIACQALFGADAESGRKQFSARCAQCHGADGRGGERASTVVDKLAPRSDQELMKLISGGLPAKGMPAQEVPGPEIRDLIAFLRTIQAVVDTRAVTKVATTTGEIEGYIRNRSNFDMQVEGLDHKIHLLRRDGGTWRRAAPGVDWPTYHGVPGGNRHTALKRIDTSNVAKMAPRWSYSIAGAGRLQVTPVVVEGVMYITAVNQVVALDSGTGRSIWTFRRPRTPGLVGDAAGGINRGVAVSGDKVFVVTDNAHLVALERTTGRQLWDVEMADSRDHYGATAAPLVVGDLVVSGISGGDEGVRGFLAAYRQSTGERAWRFWTVPARGEPLADTWVGDALEHGCAATWLTGTHDVSLDLLYWPTGNPCPDYNGDGRKGDNLYSDTVLALRPATGQLIWHYQHTPHDLHDWDSQQTPMVVDADFGGRRRKLLLQANRNGFFYVLDRESGKLLLAKPFVDKLTWASSIGSDGRPVLKPEAVPTLQGVRACPAVEGATNWMSTAFHPGTGLFYVMALEKCTIYQKSPGKWERGKSYYDGDTKRVPGEPGKKYLRAIDIRTGKIAWEYAQEGPANSWGGVLSTEGGLIFFGEDSGSFAAADARSGKLLWHHPVNEVWKASPMTYEIDGRQYVAIAAGSSVIAFGLAGM